MLKCKVCGTDYQPRKDEHYISRDNGKSGIVALAGGTEEQLFDTFDCPVCGCQIVAQERKREVVKSNCVCCEECCGEEDKDDAEA